MLLTSGVDEDTRINFMEGVNVKWTAGNDANDSDKFKIDATNILVGGNTKLTLDTSGNGNKGILVGDYKVTKDIGLKSRRESVIKTPKTDNKNGAI